MRKCAAAGFDAVTASSIDKFFIISIFIAIARWLCHKRLFDELEYFQASMMILKRQHQLIDMKADLFATEVDSQFKTVPNVFYSFVIAFGYLNTHDMCGRI
jgi:hypothetical protein